MLNLNLLGYKTDQKPTQFITCVILFFIDIYNYNSCFAGTNMSAVMYKWLNYSIHLNGFMLEKHTLN